MLVAASYDPHPRSCRIFHSINLCDFSHKPRLAAAQELVIQSIRGNCDLNGVSILVCNSGKYCPEGFLHRPLARDAKQLDNKLPDFPYLIDLLKIALEAAPSAEDWIVYTNADCILGPNFYEHLRHSTVDSIVYFRQDVPASVTTLSEIYSGTVKPFTTGIDGFAIRKTRLAELISQFEDLIIGEPYWDPYVFNFLGATCLCAQNLIDLFHVSHAQSWRSEGSRPSLLSNKKKLETSNFKKGPNNLYIDLTIPKKAETVIVLALYDLTESLARQVRLFIEEQQTACSYKIVEFGSTYLESCSGFQNRVFYQSTAEEFFPREDPTSFVDFCVRRSSFQSFIFLRNLSGKGSFIEEVRTRLLMDQKLYLSEHNLFAVVGAYWNSLRNTIRFASLPLQDNQAVSSFSPFIPWLASTHCDAAWTNNVKNTSKLTPPFDVENQAIVIELDDPTKDALVLLPAFRGFAERSFIQFEDREITLQLKGKGRIEIALKGAGGVFSRGVFVDGEEDWKRVSFCLRELHDEKISVIAGIRIRILQSPNLKILLSRIGWKTL